MRKGAGAPGLLAASCRSFEMLNLLQAFEPGTAWARKCHQRRSLQIWRGAFCTVVRADAKSAD
eukprot:4814359-Alexandrium_andersonii.AAC.1